MPRRHCAPRAQRPVVRNTGEYSEGMTIAQTLTKAQATGNDFLMFGLTRQWLKANEDAFNHGTNHLFDAVRSAGGFIIHAHPFRQGSAPVQETAVHGAEIVNGNPRHNNHNDMAWELCGRHPEYLRLAGSDTHRDGDEARAGVILSERVKDSYQYKHMIETKQFHLWSPEFQSFIDMDEEKRKEEKA